MRSIFGATLPLAGARMYEVMTPRLAGTFLGLLELVLIPIPWIFYRRGERIRARSPVIRQMREEQAVNDRKRARGGRRRERGQGEDVPAVSVDVVGNDSPEAVVVGGASGGDVVTEPKAVSGEARAVDLGADVEKGSPGQVRDG